MLIAQAERIYLRTPKIEDLDRLYRWENDDSGREGPATSRFELWQFINTYNHNAISAGYLRAMVVDRCSNDIIGYIDLCDICNDTAFIGIYIDKMYRYKGYGYESCKVLVEYTKKLKIRQLFATINSSNNISQKLFAHIGFKPIKQSDETTTWELFL